INIKTLKDELIREGAIFSSDSDTEVILHLLAKTRANLPIVESLINALSRIRGAYSLIFMLKDRMFLVRDPHGLRPLVIGKLDEGYAAASETCAFNLIGAETLREVEPGEIVEIDNTGEIKSYFPFEKVTPSPCVFEYVYFSRPDSDVFGRNVYPIRKSMGVELAKEFPVLNADMVVPVPDSGVTAAIGYSQAAGIPLEYGLIRNHYVGRTFIEPKQSIRDFGVKIKLNANSAVLKDKIVVVVDDSIVRGTTSKKIVKMLRDAGTKEIHLRISAPPITDPCFYGVDTPDKERLIGASKSIKEIADYIGVDSLAYLSVEGLYRAVGEDQTRMCDACFTGNYPVGTPDAHETKQEELFQI
ncbi:MAG: amidophosphoribosyltransferase, partial [Bdellovibrionota bacterium]